VRGVPPARPHAGPRLEPGVVLDRQRLLEAALGIAAGIDRLDQRPAALPVAPVQPLHLEFLDVAAVGQHEAQEVDRRLGGMDRPLEARPAQLGQQTGMIRVGVGQEHVVDALRRERERAVVQLADGLGALEQAAIDQEPAAVMLDQIATAGDGGGGTMERQADRHAASLRRWSGAEHPAVRTTSGQPGPQLPPATLH